MSYMPINYIIESVGLNTKSTQSSMMNGTGSTIAALTPVRVDINGDMQMIDVSTDQALSIVGLTQDEILAASPGGVVTQGRLADVTTAFAVGDYVYVSKTGALTNVLPEVGVDSFTNGDYIVRVGVIAKNEDDGNKKDIFIGISIVGQL